MKTNKLFLVLSGLFLLVSALQFTSACKSNEYNDLVNGDNIILIVQQMDISESYDSNYWENEDRLPVYDYRYGYSYRATSKYQEDLSERTSRNTYIEYDNSYYNSRYNHNSKNFDFQDEPEYYYTYEDYMGTYTKHECYSNPPADKLIYIKCP